MSEVNFPKQEEKILEFWRKNRVFERSIERRAGARDFVFYEGPPTANGRPGIHHVLSRVFKDVICRFRTMRGFRVERKAGWDTHGLPVELEIEKKFGIRSKPEIEKFGIEKFNRECQKSVWIYKEEWERMTERIGFWLDLKNPYITYGREYIESVWTILKKIWQKNLLYQDFKVVPYCPRCGTSLSSHEVALGYKSVKEPSIYVKFPIKNPKFQNVHLLVWTTTPWTLPGNVGVALNPKFIYVKVRVGDDFLILAKERVAVLGESYEIIEELKGKDLLGLTYQPPFDFYQPNYKKEKIWETIPADFVSLEEGTGLVHIAPAFGEEDMNLIRVQNAKLKEREDLQFPILMTVDERGKFNLDVKKWAGMFVKEADPLIIDDLGHRQILFKEELYQHDYPFCWRCQSPLIYYAKRSWFIKMTEVKESLIANNQKINWIPSHLKEGRFGEWLREVKDWALSRERYWGTPLPIWQCLSCQRREIIGSLKDLLEKKFSSNNYFLLRHGDSLRQVKKVCNCWPEKVKMPLTLKGQKEVEAAARLLAKKKIDLIFSSDIMRARQTAEAVARATGAKVIFDKRLREYSVGKFNGKPPKLVWDYLAGRENQVLVKLPQGERLIDIRKRMYGFLKAINGKYREKNIVIVSHELPLTVLEETLRGREMTKILELRREEKIRTMKTAEVRKIEFRQLPLNRESEVDLHRPHIDEIKFSCDCGGEMMRVPEVIDCWFDSGSMPLAQARWPGGKRPTMFPADYICEGVDQTRGWFYTLLAISTLLDFGPAYKNVISVGIVLDEKGEKMSKSRGNTVNPWDLIGKYGVDAVRWYFYTINQPGEPKLFSEKDIDGKLKKFILIFWNCFSFWETYAKKSKISNPKSNNLLDKWVVSKLNQLIKEATKSLDDYDITAAARLIERFVVEDLSLWYVRRSRRRFQKPETASDLKDASESLGFVLLTLSKLVSPFVPFLGEALYQKILYLSPEFNVRDSVHFGDWPKLGEGRIDEELNTKMNEVREIVSQSLAERAKAQIRVRQPLGKLQIPNSKLQKEFLELIKEEVNVKQVVSGETLKLDTVITPELQEEGTVREVVRQIQEMRKEAGLKPADQIIVRYTSSENLDKILNKNRSVVLKEARIKDLVAESGKTGKKELKIDQETIFLAIKKVK